jgi:hypothetical protein
VLIRLPLWRAPYLAVRDEGYQPLSAASPPNSQYRAEDFGQHEPSRYRTQPSLGAARSRMPGSAPRVEGSQAAVMGVVAATPSAFRPLASRNTLFTRPCRASGMSYSLALISDGVVCDADERGSPMHERRRRGSGRELSPYQCVALAGADDHLPKREPVLEQRCDHRPKEVTREDRPGRPG